MKILVLNGEARPGESKLARWLEDFESGLRDRGASVARVNLAERDIRFCTGCWSCWWSTPGVCVHRDDMESIYPEFLAADLVVFAAPLVLGTVSALVKKTQDRLIPLLHPYIVLDRGECHHRKRYEQYPNLGLVVEPSREDGPEDLDTVKRLFQRFAINAKAELRLFASTQGSSREAVHAALAS